MGTVLNLLHRPVGRGMRRVPSHPPPPFTDSRGPLFLLTTPSPLFYSLHFSRGLWLSFRNRTETLATQGTYMSHWWGPTNYREWISNPFFLKEIIKVNIVPFFVSLLSLRPKVVFAVQESLFSLGNNHIHYLTYIDLKEVFDWFVSKKHPRKLELRTEYWKIMMQTSCIKSNE